MYERSAIVLERYFERMFGFHKEYNLRTNYENYGKIIEELKEYQRIIEEEEKVIKKFDEVALEIEDIQNNQARIHESNLELENERNRLFNDLSENPNTLDNKLQKIEQKMDSNNEDVKELRERYVKAIVIFTERQKERNKYARIRRTAEANHRSNIENANKMFETINKKDVQDMKEFINVNKEKIQKEIINIMIKNGRNEKIPFHNHVIEKAVRVRVEIADKEAELYCSIYDRTKKILNELNNESIKLSKSEKLLRDVSVKLAFLNASKEYIVSFLDNERMTAINGKIVHERMMDEACKNFEEDILQIENLYELVIKETIGKSTKKAYKELYNKNYLRDIQEKEKYFEEEVTNIKINIGTVINSNYWRIEGIKNIYQVFQEEISEKFDKDLSEFRVEEIEVSILTGIKAKEEIEEKLEENFYNNKSKKLDKNTEEDNNDIFDDEDDDENDDEYEEDYDDEDDDEYEEDYDDEDDDEYDEDKNDYYVHDYNEYDENLYDFHFDDIQKVNKNNNSRKNKIIEDDIDNIIKNSRKKDNKKRKRQKTNEKKKNGGILGMLFKK